VVKLHAHMAFKVSSVQSVQGEVINMISEIFNALSNMKVLRNMLVPSYHYCKEANISFEQFKEKFVQSIELKKVVTNKIQDIDKVTLDNHAALPLQSKLGCLLI